MPFAMFYFAINLLNITGKYLKRKVYMNDSDS